MAYESNQVGDGNNIGLRIRVASCANFDKVRVVGEQHRIFEDTLPKMNRHNSTFQVRADSKPLRRKAPLNPSRKRWTANETDDPENAKSALNTRKGHTIERSPVKRYRPSAADRAWSKAVLERDGYQCRWIDPKTGERCPRRTNLTAHHINERSQRPDLRLELSNGAAICDGSGGHHDYLHHTVQGRKEARAQKLLGGETYEYARKAAAKK